MNHSTTIQHLQQLIKQLGQTDHLLDMLYESVDRAAIPLALSICQNNQTKTAKYLGISRTTLQKKMAHLGCGKSNETSDLP